MNSLNLKLDTSWQSVLKFELEKPYFKDLMTYIEQEYLTKSIFPRKEYIFKAFELTPFDAIKVVILGQDPYHGPNQATGLSFAVPREEKIPPSLRNIFKEVESDTGTTPDTHGDLSRWAMQGVLLLNATLTVQEKTPGSHQQRGWERFTDSVIQKISDQKEHVVFILWGNYAKQKSSLIDMKKHLVLTSPHPSPFSAYTGFFGSKPFSAANAYLKSHNKTVMDWK